MRAAGGAAGPRVRTVYGVDFSGARLAGHTTWIAEATVGRRGEPLALAALDTLARAAGTAERAPALAHLVERVRGTRDALWAIGAPFGFPVEVLDPRMSWASMLRFVRAWERDGYDLGLHYLERARALGGPMHIYRATDRLQRTPFDTYHYRIIYQTYHAIRDVLGPLARVRETAILPFQHRRLPGAARVLVETCQSSTLKRLGLPHQNYKQPEGGRLTTRRRRTRHAILDGIAGRIAIGDRERRAIMRDPGGDALDAVIAAVGAWDAWRTTDHAAVARHERYRREGFLYA